VQAGIPCNHADTVLNAIKDGVFTVDAAGLITSFNKAAEMISGRNRWEAIGHKSCDVLDTDLCYGNRCPVAETLRTGRSLEAVQTTLTTPTGRSVVVRISTTILHNTDGSTAGAVVTIRDVDAMERLRREIEGRYSFHDLVGKSAAMQDLFALIPRVADSSSSVVIEGETGTGKELVARAIHTISPRSDRAFVAINCGALPDSLLESELFGYKAGAFTDAKKDKPGRFQTAQGGTIFLDEISDISPAMQVRLLRVLQEGEVEPLGAVKPVPIDVRVIAAANRPLETLVKKGTFRDDLYYRIRVIHIELPPLRKRKEDIPVLIESLVARFNQIQGKAITGVSPEAIARLMVYHYPGNIRELENVVEQAFVLRGSGEIQVSDLPPEVRGQPGSTGVPADGTLATLERTAIEAALQRNRGHRRRAAAELGIDTSTLYRKMRTHGIRPPNTDGRTG
jgi:PAS domain S-box-containing protein